MVSAAWCVELLPRRAYEAAYTPDRGVIGFAFESQTGVDAFASDRIRPFCSKPNSLAYVPVGCPVFSASQEGGEYLRVTTRDGLARNDLPQGTFNDVIDPVAIRAAQGIRSALLANGSATLFVEEQIIALVERVKFKLEGYLAEPVKARSMTPARLRRIDELIDSSIDGEVTVTVMAAALGLSDAFFIRAFKAAVGKSPHSYLIDRRLAKARVLLKTSNHDLREIALAVGFSSHAHMTLAFRTRLGVTPSQLRRD
jgi:AraC family transcriptional regulator